MSDKLKGHEIIRLLDNLIGPVEAYGDSAADEKVLQNLKTLIDVANWCAMKKYDDNKTRCK